MNQQILEKQQLLLTKEIIRGKDKIHQVQRTRTQKNI